MSVEMLTVLSTVSFILGLVLYILVWERESGPIGEDWLRVWTRRLGLALVFLGLLGVLVHQPNLIPDVSVSWR